ncbi:hypothetical protein PVK06_035194 [Gossypium arboreum]|uniref:Uncharacterized protein n=1 Tax=Gossypium arboreum TaxID=29729 RepID=A0ABR0NGN3_GOSAR|nr:hypothetical protein PVK06_035194 [Gossypium arboreum]
MDVDVIMERNLKAIDDAGARVQVGYSNCKRLKSDGGSCSTEESNGSKLFHRRRGKGPVTSKRELTLPIPSAHYET